MILPGMPKLMAKGEAQFSDPSFVNQLLSDLPGVDLNDPQIQAAMAALGAGNKNEDKEDGKKDGTDSKSEVP